MNESFQEQNVLFRPTWAEVDLSAVDYNLGVVRKKAGKKVKILAVVKSDAYGHGMLKVSEHINNKVDFFGVASIDEAIALRRSDIKKPILIFENSFPSSCEALVDYEITPTVCSLELARSLDREAAKRRKKINIHIKVDTGMGRLGIWHKEALNFIKKIKQFSHVNVEGLYTHFPCADTDPEFTRKQIRDFKDLLNQLIKFDIRMPICHAANSMAIIGYKESYFDMVRPGLMLYGLYPKDGLAASLKLKPALSLKSKIIFIKKTPKGRTISYGATHITPRTTYIATIPVGYNDGYLRNLSNKAQVLIAGRRYRMVGRICMDQLMVDVLGRKVKLGSVVTLIGKDKNNIISVEEISHLAGTIPYEIACSIGNRQKRFYKA